MRDSEVTELRRERRLLSQVTGTEIRDFLERCPGASMLPVNIIRGSVKGTGKLYDCTVEGSVTVDEGAVLVHSRICEGASLHLGPGAVVHNALIHGSVDIGEGCAVLDISQFGEGSSMSLGPGSLAAGLVNGQAGTSGNSFSAGEGAVLCAVRSSGRFRAGRGCMMCAAVLWHTDFTAGDGLTVMRPEALAMYSKQLHDGLASATAPEVPLPAQFGRPLTRGMLGFVTRSKCCTYAGDDLRIHAGLQLSGYHVLIGNGVSVYSSGFDGNGIRMQARHLALRSGCTVIAADVCCVNPVCVTVPVPYDTYMDRITVGMNAMLRTLAADLPNSECVRNIRSIAVPDGGHYCI